MCDTASKVSVPSGAPLGAVRVWCQVIKTSTPQESASHGALTSLPGAHADAAAAELLPHQPGGHLGQRVRRAGLPGGVHGRGRRLPGRHAGGPVLPGAVLRALVHAARAHLQPGLQPYYTPSNACQVYAQRLLGSILCEAVTCVRMHAIACGCALSPASGRLFKCHTLYKMIQRVQIATHACTGAPPAAHAAQIMVCIGQ